MKYLSITVHSGSINCNTKSCDRIKYPVTLRHGNNMTNKKSFPVPAKTVRIEQVVKNSRFITTIGRASGSDEAREFIEKVRETYPDATHNCYAFIAGDPDGTTEMGQSDDGEVPGTAAKPMMNVLRHKKIGEIVAVVTRYYGGTNLGTGGLVRAYSDSVQSAIDQLKLEERVEKIPGTIEFSYNHEGAIRHIFDELNVKLDEVVYKENVLMKISIPGNNTDQFENDIAEATSGEVRVNLEK